MAANNATGWDKTLPNLADKAWRGEAAPQTTLFAGAEPQVGGENAGDNNAGDNIVLVGGRGTGKPHIATVFATRAIG